MLQRFLLFCTFFSICITGSTAQKKANPNAEEIAQAKALVDNYPEEELVILNKLEEYTFDYNSKTKKVEVLENTKKRFMSISESNHAATFGRFYDQESEIEKLQVYYKTKKSADIYVKDDYYQSNEFFYTDARVKYFRLNFPETGYQYQVNTEKRYKDIKYFTSTFFTEPYPVEKMTVRFVVPRWLKLDLKEFNFEGVGIAHESSYDSKANADIHEYSVASLDARADDRYTPGPSHVYPHILVIAKSFEQKGQSTPLFGSAKDLYGWYSSLVRQLKDDPAVLVSKVNELTANAASDQEKIESIYYWVQDNIRYIAFEDGIAGFRPEMCQNVYKNKYGDCKGMANLTKHMLQLAGFDARLTWIGTKRIAYDYSMPSLAVDNHMITTVMLDGQPYFLDPTESFNAFGEYAERIQGREAMIEDGDNFIIKKVPVSAKEDNVKKIDLTVKIEGEQLVGTGQQLFKGESRTDMQYQLDRIKTENRKEAIEEYITDDDKNFTISGVSTANQNLRGQDFEIKYDFVLKNHVSSFGNDLYIDLDYNKVFSGFEFDEKRKSDYLFPLKILRETTITLEIPEGYIVSELPGSIKEIHPDFSFNISYEQKNNTIIYTNKISVGQAIIPYKSFGKWNEIIKKLTELYQEQVVLTKKS